MERLIIKVRRVKAICLALAVLCVGLGTWAVTGQVRTSKLSARVRALEAEVEANAAGPAASVNVADPDAIAAEFNGGVVTAGEAAQEYAMISSYYQMFGMDEAEYAEDAKKTVLDGLVEGKILEIKAREAGVYEISDAQMQELEARVEQEYEDNIRYYMEFRFDESKTEEEVRAETIEYLNENGYSYESMLEEAVKNAWQNRLFEYVTANMTITDEQMLSFYESQRDSAEMTYTADFSEYEMDAEAGRTLVWNPEGVRKVDSILVSFGEEQSVEYLTLQAALEEGDSAKLDELNALYAEIEPQAQQVLDRLNAGEDFAQLMAEYGSVNANGTYVSAQSTICGDAFRDAAMVLGAVGDVSGLVRTDGGICILRYAADVPAGSVPFEDVKDELRSVYEAELKSSQYNATVVQWIQEANIQYHTDTF